MEIKAVIVDDEEASRLFIQDLLAKHHPEVKVLACGTCVREGCELITQHEPDVVFLDIEMPDGLGFDVLQQVQFLNFQVIFVTAHHDYAITAIRFGALDYLLKPIDPEDLQLAMRRASSTLLQERISREQIQILIETLQRFENRQLPSRIAISTSNGILYHPVEQVMRLEAQQNYTAFSIRDRATPILASVNIGEYVEPFERYREFMKVHRSHIINLHYVERYHRGEGYVEMQGGAQVNVSRPYREELLRRLGEI